ncbi:MAG: hypothetical protein AAGK14_01790 [Verrucomicrobiota bacterium]
MLETVEARWFFPGKLPKAVRRWHSGLGPALVDEPARTDVYLRGGGKTLGTKLRQGSLQLKARVGLARRAKLAPGATATVATWRKWDFTAHDTDSVTEPLFHDPANWIHVRKKRAQHYFCWHRRSGLIEQRREAEATCGVELVRVRVGGRAWWSLALEAAAPSGNALSGGPPKLARRCVEAVAARIFAAPGAPRCPLKRSQSYPEWLARISPG